MKAFKCDICGKYYDYYEFANTIAFISKDKSGNWTSNDAVFLDICLDCSRKMKRVTMIPIKEE